VKEEILTRLGELGVRVREGRVQFRPRLLRRSEFLRSSALFEPFGVGGERLAIQLPPNTLAFTYCQVPVVYHLGGAPRIELTGPEGRTQAIAGDSLDRETSASVFERRGQIRRIDVFTAPGR
jgi:hypothetical protein